MIGIYIKTHKKYWYYYLLTLITGLIGLFVTTIVILVMAANNLPSTMSHVIGSVIAASIAAMPLLYVNYQCLGASNKANKLWLFMVYQLGSVVIYSCIMAFILYWTVIDFRM